MQEKLCGNGTRSPSASGFRALKAFLNVTAPGRMDVHCRALRDAPKSMGQEDMYSKILNLRTRPIVYPSPMQKRKNYSKQPKHHTQKLNWKLHTLLPKNWPHTFVNSLGNVSRGFQPGSSVQTCRTKAENSIYILVGVSNCEVMLWCRSENSSLE